MRRWLLYTTLLALIALFDYFPFNGTDVAKLKPVELIRVSALQDRILVETDTDNKGIGKNLSEAFDDLEATTAGVIFLETADHLIITEEAVALLPELVDFLRPGCNVYLEQGAADVKTAASFLSAHASSVALNDLRAQQLTIPVLITQGERMYLVE